MNKIAILGCGGHARSVADVILYNNPDTEIVFVDDNAKENEVIYNFHIVKEYDFQAGYYHCASGNNLLRKLHSKHSISIISNDAYIAPSANIKQSVFVGHLAYIGPFATIGSSTIINTRSVIEHEATVGDFTHISVNATLCGRVKIGSNVFIGAGAVIKDGVTIVDNTIIGAGAVVVRNIDESGTYAGVPSRRIK